MTKAYVIKGWHMIDNGPPRAREIEWIVCACSSKQSATARIEKILEAGCAYHDDHIKIVDGTAASGERYLSIQGSTPSTRDRLDSSIFESDNFPFSNHMRTHKNGDANFPKKLKLSNAFYYTVQEVDYYTD